MLPHEGEHKVSKSFEDAVNSVVDTTPKEEFWDNVTDADNSKEYGLGSFGQVVAEGKKIKATGEDSEIDLGDVAGGDAKDTVKGHKLSKKKVKSHNGETEREVHEEEELSEAKDVYIKPSDKAPRGWEGKFFEMMDDDMDDVGFSGEYLIVPKKLEKTVTKYMQKLKVKFTKESIDESVSVDGRTKGFKDAVKRLAAYKDRRDAKSAETTVNPGSTEISNDDVEEIVAESKMMNDKQLNILRSQYAKINKIDPMGGAYKKMKALLGKMDKDQLKGLAYAKIKWLSSSAAIQLMIKHNIRLKASDYMSEETKDEVNLDNAEYTVAEDVNVSMVNNLIKGLAEAIDNDVEADFEHKGKVILGLIESGIDWDRSLLNVKHMEVLGIKEELLNA